MGTFAPGSWPTMEEASWLLTTHRNGSQEEYCTPRGLMGQGDAKIGLLLSISFSTLCRLSTPILPPHRWCIETYALIKLPLDNAAPSEQKFGR
jgi:hypothetical protein